MWPETRLIGKADLPELPSIPALWLPEPARDPPDDNGDDDDHQTDEGRGGPPASAGGLPDSLLP